MYLFPSSRRSKNIQKLCSMFHIYNVFPIKLRYALCTCWRTCRQLSIDWQCIYGVQKKLTTQDKQSLVTQYITISPRFITRTSLNLQQLIKILMYLSRTTNLEHTKYSQNVVD